MKALDGDEIQFAHVMLHLDKSVVISLCYLCSTNLYRAYLVFSRLHPPLRSMDVF